MTVTGTVTPVPDWSMSMRMVISIVSGPVPADPPVVVVVTVAAGTALVPAAAGPGEGITGVAAGAGASEGNAWTPASPQGS